MTDPNFITFFRQENDEGTSYTDWWVLEVPEGWSDDDVADYVDDRFARERCEHEHDCCGHYYAQRGIWSWHDRRARKIVISQSYNRNI